MEDSLSETSDERTLIQKRIDGKTFDQIATGVTFTDSQDARDAFTAALSIRPVLYASPEEWRILAIERLEETISDLLGRGDLNTQELTQLRAFIETQGKIIGAFQGVVPTGDIVIMEIEGV